MSLFPYFGETISSGLADTLTLFARARTEPLQGGIHPGHRLLFVHGNEESAGESQERQGL